jgi:hypothetical protein
MTNEQINRAIAEACGWSMEDGVWVWTADGIDCTYYELWDWANDLNAMHEAEKTIYKHNNLWTAYYYAVGAGPFSLHVTARKKAEAFLRTLGKWEEVQP